MSKCLTVLLLSVLVSSIIITSGFVYASTPKPSTPEFTLKIVARPYDVPPTATIDPYTGKTVITQGGYHVENKSIDVIIKNQPSTSYYQIQFKGHSGANWQFYSDTNMITPIQLGYYHPKSNGDYTIISVPLNSDKALNINGAHVGSVTNFPKGGVVDFQVRALLGQLSVKQSGIMGEMAYFDGETGDWSSTQTITVGENTPAVTPDASYPAQSLSPSGTQNSGLNQSTQITIQLGVDWPPLATLLLLGIITGLLATVVVLLLVLSRKKINSIDPRIKQLLAYQV